MEKSTKFNVGDVKKLLKKAHVPFSDASKLLGLPADELGALDDATEFSDEMLKKLDDHYSLDIPEEGGTEEGEAQAAARLRQVREQMGLSQADFGLPIGLTQAGVSKFEMNNIPLRKLVLIAIEHVYGVNRDWIKHGTLPERVHSHVLTERDIKVLDIASQLAPDALDLWCAMGRCFVDGRRDGSAERRQRRKDRRNATERAEAQSQS